MKNIFSVLFVFFCTFLIFAQEKITWTGEFDSERNIVLLTASLADGWHVYSQNVNEMAGPVATQFRWMDNPDLNFENTIVEPNPIASYDENFEADVLYFEKEVVFTQKVEAVKNTTALYSITYMICNDEMCLPPVDKEVVVKIIK